MVLLRGRRFALRRRLNGLPAKELIDRLLPGAGADCLFGQCIAILLFRHEMKPPFGNTFPMDLQRKRQKERGVLFPDSADVPCRAESPKPRVWQSKGKGRYDFKMFEYLQKGQAVLKRRLQEKGGNPFHAGAGGACGACPAHSERFIFSIVPCFFRGVKFLAGAKRAADVVY